MIRCPLPSAHSKSTLDPFYLCVCVVFACSVCQCVVVAVVEL